MPRDPRGGAGAVGAGYLHGDLSIKEASRPRENENEETIQRLLLEFRRAGLIPYESISDDTRPTSYGEDGYDDINEARESIAGHRQRVVDSYALNIWLPQGKRVEFFSEKQALEPIVERVTRPYQVDLTSCKGFSSESMLYRVARRIALSGMPTVVLTLTDHDRAAYNMAEHVERMFRRLVELICQQYGVEIPPLTFIRVGLTGEQVDRYDVMTRNPKSNEHEGMRNYAEHPAEIDALRSAQIAEIVREGIEAQLDQRILRRTRTQERRDQATLRRELEAEE